MLSFQLATVDSDAAGRAWCCAVVRAEILDVVHAVVDSVVKCGSGLPGRSEDTARA